MKQKKKNSFLDKLIKKDYKNELEKILDKKKFDENVKSALLSMLYKIEASYKDLETVKRDVEKQDEYIAHILDIIKNDCDSFEILKMNDESGEIPHNKTFVVNKEEKSIIAHPIDRKILYAIAKIEKKDKIIKDKYCIIDETLSELINIGNNIDMVEPLRDFNGYSWTSIPGEIESIDHNLVYQDLRMLVGHQILNKWIKSKEFMIDYFDSFKGELESKYGIEIAEEIVDIISNISILLSMKFNKGKREEFSDEKDKVEAQLKKIRNKDRFISRTTAEKIEKEKKIKNIDLIINNKKLLKEEYERRNKELPLEQKIFSMRILSQMMKKEKEELLKEIDKANKILKPRNFVKYTKELEYKDHYLQILDVISEKRELELLKLELQRAFLDAIRIDVMNANSKDEIEKIIYNFRYYLQIPFNSENRVQDIKKLNRRVNTITREMIDKAIELKLIEKISENEEVNYEIYKNIFYVKIINLEDANLKITRDKQKRYFLQIFDENIFEEKVEIGGIYENNIFRGNKNSYRFKLFNRSSR